MKACKIKLDNFNIWITIQVLNVDVRKRRVISIKKKTHLFEEYIIEESLNEITNKLGFYERGWTFYESGLFNYLLKL